MFANSFKCLCAVSLVAGFIGLNGAIAGTNNAGIGPRNTPCLIEQKAWKKKEGWKAVSVSTNYWSKKFGTTQSCGHSWGYGNKAEALRVALSFCRSELRKMDKSKKARCRITLARSR
jgi:hypothetical protein